MTANRIKRPEAKVIAEEEFRRFAELVASLSTAEWTLPTDCEAWDVRKMVLHVLGSGDAQASFPQFVHQLLRGVHVLSVTQLARQTHLFLLGEQGETRHGLNIRLEASGGRGKRHRNR